MNFILVNGINSDGSGSVDLLGNVLRGRGHTVIDIEQPIRHTWHVRSKKKRYQDAMDIVCATPAEGEWTLIGHSYGGIKCLMASEHVAYRHIYLFRPAVSRNYPIPQINLGRVTCIYSPKDWTVWAGSMLFWHPFGQAGVRGFNNPFVKNIRSPFEGGHSHDFRGYGSTYWANRIIEDLAMRQAEDL